MLERQDALQEVWVLYAARRLAILEPTSPRSRNLAHEERILRKCALGQHEEMERGGQS